MNIGFLIGLTRLRLAMIVAGLAWFAGLDVPPGMRIAIATFVVIALFFDGLLDEKRIAHPSKSPPRDRYQSAA